MTPPRLDEGSEREAFEASIGRGRDLHRDAGGDYMSIYVQNDWEAWQARAALSTGRLGGEWISVDERLPGPGVAVLAFFRNSYGKGRVVRAHHAPKHTIEAGHWDEDAEADETEDGSFEPEGWYEDPAVGETLSFISPQSDGIVTHWQPIPPAPAAKPQGDSNA